MKKDKKKNSCKVQRQKQQKKIFLGVQPTEGDRA
jgi:hypothetical protein